MAGRREGLPKCFVLNWISIKTRWNSASRAGGRDDHVKTIDFNKILIKNLWNSDWRARGRQDQAKIHWFWFDFNFKFDLFGLEGGRTGWPSQNGWMLIRFWLQNHKNRIGDGRTKPTCIDFNHIWTTKLWNSVWRAEGREDQAKMQSC